MSELLVYKASAGSGKTFTLAVEYIKLLILNPCAYRQILAVTFTKSTQRKLEAYWGVTPIFSDIQNELTNDDELASTIAKGYGLKPGQLLIMSAGYPTGEGSANMMKIIEIK